MFEGPGQPSFLHNGKRIGWRSIGSHDHCNFFFCVPDGAGLFDKLCKMNVACGVAEKIKMHTLVGYASNDIFFISHPAKISQAIGSNATLVPFDDSQAAGAHC